jgi:hypothetical protein
MKQTTFNWLLAAFAVLVFALAQQLDAYDFESAADAERKEWVASMHACRDMHSVESFAELSDSGWVCVTRRGDVLKGSK